MSASERQARVVESFGRRVIVEDQAGDRTSAELFGKRLTCVCGDIVRVRAPAQDGDVPRVVGVEPRQTLFARTDSRGRTEPLAANLSLLVATLAPEPPPDPFIADRYLAGAAYAGIDSLVVVNKCDLPSAQDPSFHALVDELETAGYEILRLSAHELGTIGPLRERLRDQLGMFVGQSGVGKSSLANQLAPASSRVTRELSTSTREGRHTTVSTALFRIPTGGELIDSPGVRDYAPPLLEDAQVQVGWPELMRLSPECRFNNCLHLREPGCAVTSAVEAGTLSARRYESYKRLVNIMRGLAPEYERRR